MKQEKKTAIFDLTDTPSEQEPVVNEECGDTMWDAVLATDGTVPNESNA